MPQAGSWRCDQCEVRWYGTDPTCWVCDRPGRSTVSLYTPDNLREGRPI